jgi:hypothetical protein
VLSLTFVHFVFPARAHLQIVPLTIVHAAWSVSPHLVHGLFGQS